MIFHIICDLRGENWTRAEKAQIREHLDHDGNPVTRQVIRWHRPDYIGPKPFRAYVVLMSDGCIYAVFFQHRKTTDNDRRRQAEINQLHPNYVRF